MEDGEALPKEKDPKADPPPPKAWVEAVEEVLPKPKRLRVSLFILPAFAKSPVFVCENTNELS